jgi:Cro/C1-type HTH DNA-binding domain
MMQAYSRLKRLLGERKITVPELHKRIQQRGMHGNLKSLYRLSREHQPLARLDLRVAGAICQVCEVPLSELITFETPKGTLQHLSGAKQKRLDTLMAKNNAGQLTGGEREELRALVREAEEMTLANARILAGQR